MAETNKIMNASSSESPDQMAETATVEHVNRLSKETSPYLLQHARNPVDWYPWGEEAIRRARAENKPIFVSIGYSTCHWCHVMERESFEDLETAEILNRHFVPVKIDREERPDLDEIYMTAVQIMTGRGGWPLSVFLTPELKPFFGGTYFPPEDRYGMPSFKRVLNSVSQAWQEKSDQVADSAERLTKALKANTVNEVAQTGTLDASIFLRASAELDRTFDSQWGGFGGAPKFPPGSAIAFLLRQQFYSGDKRLLDMATTTLDKMAFGGIHDQIGGGFHRYSVDAQWLVPHFEKMLYDNAILARVYLDAWQVTHNELYRQVAEGIFDYVLRDVTDSRGGFHSAEDADSEGEEGKFYVWKPDEIKAVLGDREGRFFCEYYDVTEQGNFEGRNILNVPQGRKAFLDASGLAEEELETQLEPLRQKLLAQREKRVRPGKDDKVLAAWNGLMISAFAKGYQVLGDRRYLDAANKAADFVMSEMIPDGTLLRTYRAHNKIGSEADSLGNSEGDSEGISKLPGYLDDYAEMASALVDLYEASFDLARLQQADKLTSKMLADFWDDEDGGFYYTSADHVNLLVRTKPFYDGPVPSGNATATIVLLRLAKFLDNIEYLRKAETVLKLLSDDMQAQPGAHFDLLSAASFYLRPGGEIAIVGSRERDDTKKFLHLVRSKFVPNRIVAFLDPNQPDSHAATRLLPLLEGKQTGEGNTTVYVCENFACKQPVSEEMELIKVLDSVR